MFAFGWPHGTFFEPLWTHLGTQTLIPYRSKIKHTINTKKCVDLCSFFFPYSLARKYSAHSGEPNGFPTDILPPIGTPPLFLGQDKGSRIIRKKKEYKSTRFLSAEKKQGPNFHKLKRGGKNFSGRFYFISIDK